MQGPKKELNIPNVTQDTVKSFQVEGSGDFLSAYVFQWVSESFQVILSAVPILHPNWLEEKFCWAATQFSCVEVWAIVPLLDLLSHSNDSELVTYTVPPPRRKPD